MDEGRAELEAALERSRVARIPVMIGGPADGKRADWTLRAPIRVADPVTYLVADEVYREGKWGTGKRAVRFQYWGALDQREAFDLVWRWLVDTAVPDADS